MFKGYYLFLSLAFLCGALHAQENIEEAYSGVRAVFFNNTDPNADTYAPFRYGDKVYFTTKYESNRQSYINGVFGVSHNRNNATVLDINSKKEGFHTSNMVIAPDGQTMYYTICKGKGQEDCTIWSRKKLYNGKWAAASKLPMHINLRSTTSTQPAIGYDWSKKTYTLYFVSDRPGGKGGLDLWHSSIDRDGNYGVPKPLPFNTEKDDITPYFHSAEKTLFFSSNGRKGFGGFDIYSCQMLSKGGWESPMNQGNVVNSTYDESYFTFHASSKKGYFASNRPSGGFQKNNVRKLTYKVFEIIPIVELTLPVYNAYNMTMVYNTSAYVYDETTGQRRIFTERPFDKNLTVTLFSDRTYRVVVIKDGYLPAVIEISTEGVVFPVSLNNEVHLFMDEALPYSNRETYGKKVKTVEVEMEELEPDDDYRK